MLLGNEVTISSSIPLGENHSNNYSQKRIQLPNRTITGRVSDSNDVALIGVTVRVKGTKNGTVTGMNGHYKLELSGGNRVLEFSYLGYEAKDVPVNGRSEVNVVLSKSSSEINEVVVTAFGTEQKKESVVGAISSVTPSDLKIPSGNLTQSFAGKLPGVIAFQRSGEPGKNNAKFFIRGVTSFSTSGKKDPLILVDGIEMTSNDLARLNVDDIASFSVLKDATAAALYGARGANGVILITTKEGSDNELKITVRGEISRTANSNLVKLADPITYMKLYNKAVRTRNSMVTVPFTKEKIRKTELGNNPLFYPSVDWYHSLIANSTTNKRLNINFTGGGQAVQYYLSAKYENDKGILKETKNNLINSNININRLQIRSNVTIKFSPTTTGVIRAYGTMHTETGPKYGGANVFSMARNASPVMFQPYYPPDSARQYSKHVLFGSGPQLGFYTNPLAEEVSSYQKSKASMMLWQLEMEHRFTGALKGLNIKGRFNTMRKSAYSYSRGYNPFYYTRAQTIDGSYKLVALNPKDGTNYLSYSAGNRTADASMYGELNINYNRTFNGGHDLGVMLVGTIRSESGATAVQADPDHKLKASLARRNISTAGRFSYGYKSRYFMELDFGYNGSERFSRKNRWGFFPAVGVGWMVSKEPFMSGLNDVISKMKLRATYGMIGNDQIGSLYDRFFYLSQVNMNGDGYWFGLDRQYLSGITIERYANPKVTWEKAKKTDLGLNLGLFDNHLSLSADLYFQTRRNILQTRADVPSTMGVRTTPKTNIGVAKGHGFEMSLKYNKYVNKDLWLIFHGNFTYATSAYQRYEEPDYSDVPWKSHIGRKLNQPMGYIAERLFIDNKEVENSPEQEFGKYGAGDIKYKDINGDGVINKDDIVPIGFPTVPKIIYGAGISMGYKNFDFSVFVQGSAKSSFFISPSDITPFVNHGQRGLLKDIAEDHWSKNNRNLHAFWPRLSDYAVENNNQASTYWLRNGAFMRLKSAELGYTLPSDITEKIHIKMFRIYVSGLNLFMLWSKFKLWDVEMGGNGLGYPIQRVINAGVNLQF